MLEEIRRNWNSLQQSISDTALRAGRDPAEVKIVVVTKTVGVNEIRTLLSLGIKDIGENRVQDAKKKYQAIGPTGDWHFIGHLQKNKVKEAIKFAKLIHSVDSRDLLLEIDKRAEVAGKKQSVLLQVNLQEKGRFGFNPREVADVMAESENAGSLAIEGLMTMAPFTTDRDQIRETFSSLRKLRDEIQVIFPEYKETFRELSMGMSNDYDIAIEEYSTIVRIGSAIFKGVGI